MKAIVTGGCRGLGYAFTKYLASLGYTVYALYNTTKLKEEENIIPLHCDISNEMEIIDVLNKIGPIDLLINNAALSLDNEYQDKTKEEFMKVLEVNVVGTFLMIKHSIKHLTKEGTIINISSNNTLGNNSPLSMDYDASKAGINMITKNFSEILPQKVVAICPGWINTEAVQEMNPKYLKEEMAKVNQKELINPNSLVKKILSELDTYQTGDIIEIKEL